jgi:ABC-type xylose transport system permease subunit
MYITFLLCLIAAASILGGARATGAMFGFITVAVIGALLLHHMTDKLPISL